MTSQIILSRIGISVCSLSVSPRRRSLFGVFGAIKVYSLMYTNLSRSYRKSSNQEYSIVETHKTRRRHTSPCGERDFMMLATAGMVKVKVFGVGRVTTLIFALLDYTCTH